MEIFHTELPREYLLLFNTISEAETILENLKQKLIKAQMDAEELYINRS